jgi:AcrR family transcriptional regulator
MDTPRLILRIAQDFFARFGFNKTTIDDIAGAAHIAKSTLYHHFSSKQDIFRRVVEHEGETLANQISIAVDAAYSAEGKMRAYIVTRLRYLKELANYYSALKDDYLEHYSFIEKLREKDLRDETAMLRQILRDGISTGTFRIKDEEVEITALAVMTALKGLEYPWIANEEILDIDKHAEVLLNLLFHGICADNPGESSDPNVKRTGY